MIILAVVAIAVGFRTGASAVGLLRGRDPPVSRRRCVSARRRSGRCARALHHGVFRRALSRIERGTRRLVVGVHRPSANLRAARTIVRAARSGAEPMHCRARARSGAGRLRRAAPVLTGRAQLLHRCGMLLHDLDEVSLRRRQLVVELLHFARRFDRFVRPGRLRFPARSAAPLCRWCLDGRRL